MKLSNCAFFSFSFVIYVLTGLLAPKVEATVLVSSIRNNSILRYNDKTGEFIDTFVPSGSGGLDGPSGIAIGPDGNLYVISIRTDSVLRYDGKTGKFIDTFVSAKGQIDFAEDLLFGSDGNFYLSNLNNTQQNRNSVLRYDGKTGAFIDNFVAPGSGGLFGPLGINFGSDGNLYVASVSSNQILRYNGKTGAFIDIFAATDNPNFTFADFNFGLDGNLYVANPRNNSVSRYDGRTGKFIDFFVTSGSGGLERPVEAVFGLDGNLYVNSFETNRILRYNGKTGAFIDAFITAGSGGLDGPTSIAFVKDIPESNTQNAILTFAVISGFTCLFHNRKKQKLNS